MPQRRSHREREREREKLQLLIKHCRYLVENSRNLIQRSQELQEGVRETILKVYERREQMNDRK